MLWKLLSSVSNLRKLNYARRGKLYYTERDVVVGSILLQSRTPRFGTSSGGRLFR